MTAAALIGAGAGAGAAGAVSGTSAGTGTNVGRRTSAGSSTSAGTGMNPGTGTSAGTDARAGAAARAGAGAAGAQARTESAAISVTVNGNRVDLARPCTLEELLQRLGERPDAQATAVNGEFVPRGLRAARLLRDGDAVSCFKPIVGG